MHGMVDVSYTAVADLADLADLADGQRAARRAVRCAVQVREVDELPCGRPALGPGTVATARG